MNRLEHVWSRTNLSTSTKIRIYTSCVFAVLLYGLETWTITQLDWRRLESFHKSCQWRILRIRWHDCISNNKVLHCTGLLAASSIVRKRPLGLFGRVARHADDVPANRILRTCCEAEDGVICYHLLWTSAAQQPEVDGMFQSINS